MSETLVLSIFTLHYTRASCLAVALHGAFCMFPQHQSITDDGERSFNAGSTPASVSRTKIGRSDNVDKLMLPKYTFADITVFMKTGEGNEYLNITDYSVLEENERLCFNSDSPYVIMFCSYFYNSYKKDGQKPYICDISFEELLDLAGIHDKGFLKRFDGASEGANEELLAILCARRILDYRYGRAVKGNKGTYSFFRQTSYKVDGKSRRHLSLVVEKQFYKA